MVVIRQASNLHGKFSLSLVSSSRFNPVAQTIFGRAEDMSHGL